MTAIFACRSIVGPLTRPDRVRLRMGWLQMGSAKLLSRAGRAYERLPPPRLETMQQRVRVREPGMRQPEFVQRTGGLETVLDAARLEDFLLTNERLSRTLLAF